MHKEQGSSALVVMSSSLSMMKKANDAVEGVYYVEVLYVSYAEMLYVSYVEVLYVKYVEML